MKAKQIRFFTQEENTEETKKEKEKVVKAAPITGYISSAGKLVFPNKSIADLGFDPETTSFKIGTLEGKRKIKSLFIVSAPANQEGTFSLAKGAKSYSISLPIILQKGSIDFANEKYGFTVKPFAYDNGVAYELKLTSETPKPEYTGKPRGRKRLNPDA